MICRIPIIFLMVAVVFTTISGCLGTGAKKIANYETIKANPKRDPHGAAVLNKQGIEALAKGKCEKAENLFKEALIKDVDFGPAHNNLGRLYFEQEKNYLAAWEFEYAAKVMPDRYEPRNNLGLVMERVGKIDQAIEAYEMANTLCPNNPEIVGNLARTHWCRDKTNPRTRELMEHVVFIDSRPCWVSWAKEQIACGKLNSAPGVAFTQESLKLPSPVDSFLVPEQSHLTPPYPDDSQVPATITPLLPQQRIP
ncbi:MAG: tetratricopeptide repeat protein [Planctomycetia bacterium]|nr:tetratricopeptide repeat protein [Planctomycetia bacterium]